jgi:CheY-specific phosphatase CheX
MEEELKDIDGKVKDVIGEIANTVAGNIKEELADFDFENALPNIYLGSDKKLNLPEGFKCYSVSFETEFGYFILRVSVLDDVEAPKA